MMERLNTRAVSGDVEALYSIIAEDPYVLERIDGMRFADTPLHVAAAAGNTHFAMEMANLKPSFARKLNHLGLSPMHLALLNHHDELVRSIITTDSELVRVKAKGMVTPLHYVAQTGKIHLLVEFLCLCPSAIEDLTVKCETIVHLAVKNNQWDAFKVLLSWLKQSNKEEILKWKDDDGNTVLHIAAAKNQLQVVKLVIPNVNVNAKNLDGKTAMDIINPQGNSTDSEIGKTLHCAGAKRASDLGSTTTLKVYLSFIEGNYKYLGIFSKSRDKSSNDLRNIVLVVAVLIAAAAYQAALSPPGGYWQENSQPTNDTANNNTPTGQGQQHSYQAGEMILGYLSRFSLFYFTILNSSAFYVSVCTILIIISGLPFSHILALATSLLSWAYFVALSATWPYVIGSSTLAAFRIITCLIVLSVYVLPLVVSSKLAKAKNKDPMDVITRRQLSS